MDETPLASSDDAEGGSPCNHPSPPSSGYVRDLEGIEQLYQRLLGRIREYVFTVQVENGIPTRTTHEPNCIAITGYSPAEFGTNPQLWIQMVPPEDRPIVQRQVAHILAGVEAEPIEHRILRKDGKLRSVLNVPFPRCDAQGTLIAYDGLVIDITERESHAAFDQSMREVVLAGQMPGFVRTECPVCRTDVTVRVNERHHRHIAEFLQEDLQQILAAARYHVDRISRIDHSNEEVRNVLRTINDLLLQSIQKSSEISRGLLAGQGEY